MFEFKPRYQPHIYDDCDTSYFQMMHEVIWGNPYKRKDWKGFIVRVRDRIVHFTEEGTKVDFDLNEHLGTKDWVKPTAEEIIAWAEKHIKKGDRENKEGAFFILNAILNNEELWEEHSDSPFDPKEPINSVAEEKK